MAKKDVKITFRVPAALRGLVKEYLALDAYMNESEFYRDAAREKIHRDAPTLYGRLFTKEAAQKYQKTG